MRIISKGNDYYDSAQAYGQDQSVVYKRKENKILLPSNDKLTELVKYRKSLVTSSDTAVFSIGFCGLVYTGLNLFLDYTTNHIFYNINEVDKVLDTKKYRKRYHEKNWYGKSDRDGLVKFFNKHPPSPKYLDSFIQYDTPIWMICDKGEHYRDDQGHWHYDSYIIINPILKDYGFARIFDPYTAYQEIAMFVEGPLAHEKIPDPTNVPDKYLAAAKGYDSWSFRKQPTKKGRKAKRRV